MANFDPDAYLAAKQPAQGGFDPDTYLAGKQSFDPDQYLAAKVTPAAQIQDPVAHAAAFQEGHPEYEAAFQADQAQKARPIGEKIAAAGKTALTLAPWTEGAKSVGKFALGLVGTPLHAIAQGGLTAAAPVLDAIGQPDLAQKARAEAQTEGAESVLAGQKVEQGLRNVARAAGNLMPAGGGDVSGSMDTVSPETPEEVEAAKLRQARSDFAGRVQSARNAQTLAAGKPLDTGAVATLSQAATGAPPSEAFSPENLEAVGARQVSPLVTDAMAAAGDPQNLLLAAAPELPGARLIAGGGVELAGKALQVPMNLIGKLPGRVGKFAKAMTGTGALTAETAAAAAIHPPSAALTGSLLGMKLSQKLGQVLEAQGSEFRTGLPSALTEAAGAAQDAGKSSLIPNMGRAIGDTAVRGVATAYGMAPINAITSEGDPEQFAQSEIGAGLFGAGLGALHAPASMRAMDAALQSKLMDQHGQTQFTENPAYDAHRATVSTFTPDDQSRINRLRSFLYGGTNTDVLVVDGKTFAQSNGTDIGADARGKMSDDGSTIYLNADAVQLGESPGAKTADTAGHEAGHAVVNWLSDMGKETQANGLMQSIADKMSPQDMSDLTQSYWDALKKSTKNLTPEQSAQIEAANPPQKILEENLSEITRAILDGKDVSQFTLSKPLSEKIMDTAARTMEALKLSPSIDPNASLAFKARMVKEAARRMNDMLYDVGAQARDTRAKGPTAAEAMRDLQSQLDGLAKPTPDMPASQAQALAAQRDALQARMTAWQKVFQTDVETASPQPAAQESPNTAALAQSRQETRTYLQRLGFKAGQINQWINDAYQQHGSPISQTQDLVKSVLRMSRGETVKPGEFIPKPPETAAPAAPVAAPVGTTFKDEAGNTKVVTGASDAAPRVGDIVSTRQGEIRRVSRVAGDTVDTARPIDPLNARGTKTHPIGDVTPLEHDYTEEPATTGATEPAQPGLTVAPGPAGSFIVVDQAGNPVGKNTFATETAARQSIAKTGQKSTFGLPPSVNGNDIINAIMEHGGIHLDSMLKEERDHEFPHKGVWRNALRTDNADNTPDEIARILEAEGHGDGTPGTMFSEITDAIAARSKLRDDQAKETDRQKTESKLSNDEPTPTPDESVSEGTVATEPALAPDEDTAQPAPLSAGDIARISSEAEADVKSKRTSRQKASTLPKAITDAQVDALAAAHTATVPENYEGLKLRTDTLGKQSISGKVNPERPFDAHLIKLADLSPAAVDNLQKLQDRIGQTVTLDYQHAPESEEKVTADTRRAAQKASTAQDRASGEAESQTEAKNFIPLEVRFNKGKDTPSFTVLGASPEKLLSNFNLASEALRSLGEEPPYPRIHDPHLVADMKGVARNHAAGWNGDGSSPITQFPDVTIPTNPEGYTPYRIPQERFQFLNLILGDESAKTGKKGASPEQTLKQGLAVANAVPIDASGETNALRLALNAVKGPQIGKDGQPTTWSKANLENPLSETLRADLVAKVHDEVSNDDRSIRPHGYTGDIGRFFGEGSPNRTFTASGFMPQETEEEAKVSEERMAIADAWKGSKTIEQSKPGDDYNGWVDAKQDILSKLTLPDGWKLKDDSNFHTKWGSAYYYLEDPDGDSWKLRVGDHGASQSRASENDYAFEVSKPATLQSWAKAVDSIEEWLRRKNDEIYPENEAAAGFMPSSGDYSEKQARDIIDGAEMLPVYGGKSDHVSDLSKIARDNAGWRDIDANTPAKQKAVERMKNRESDALNELRSITASVNKAGMKSGIEDDRFKPHRALVFDEDGKQVMKDFPNLKAWIQHVRDNNPATKGMEGRFMPEDTGAPEEGGTPGERLAREAEQAGVVLSIAALKGLIAQDPDTMDRIRQRVQQQTGKPARFMPSDQGNAQPGSRIPGLTPASREIGGETSDESTPIKLSKYTPSATGADLTEGSEPWMQRFEQLLQKEDRGPLSKKEDDELDALHQRVNREYPGGFKAFAKRYEKTAADILQGGQKAYDLTK